MRSAAELTVTLIDQGEGLGNYNRKTMLKIKLPSKSCLSKTARLCPVPLQRLVGHFGFVKSD